MVEAIESLADRVLEIGPGHIPFGPATEFVDWQVSPSLAGRTVHVLDINAEPLPFSDGSFDFIYCRHTLEDIYDPMWVGREMGRVGRAGQDYDRALLTAVQQCIGHTGAVIERFLGVPQAPADTRAT